MGTSLTRVGIADRVETPDGGSAEIYLPDEEKPDSCMFALHGDLSPSLADTIMPAATPANCAIYWPADPPLMPHPYPAMLPHMPPGPDAPNPVHCPTASRLRLLVHSLLHP